MKQSKTHKRAVKVSRYGLTAQQDRVLDGLTRVVKADIDKQILRLKRDKIRAEIIAKKSLITAFWMASVAKEILEIA